MDGPINCTTCDMLILMGQFERKNACADDFMLQHPHSQFVFNLLSICAHITRVKSLKQIRKPLTLLRDKRDPSVGQPVFFYERL